MCPTLEIKTKLHCLYLRVPPTHSLCYSYDAYSEGGPTTLLPVWNGDKSSIVLEINRSELWPVMGASGSRIIIWC